MTPIKYSRRSNKTCGHICSGIYSNKKRTQNNWKLSDETKIKIKESINEYNTLKKIEKETKYLLSPFYCSICNNSLKYEQRKRKTCSFDCHKQLISNLINIRIENGANLNKNRGKNKKSYLETSFENWLLTTTNIEYIMNYQIKRYDEQNNYLNSYYIDFYFPSKSLGIELDGTQHLNTIEYDTNRDNYINNTYNIQMIRISHKEYISKTRIDEIKQLLYT